MQRESDQLIQDGLCRTDNLTVDGAIGHLLDWTADEKWERIKYLRLFTVEKNAGSIDEEEDPEGDRLYLHQGDRSLLE